MKKLKKLRIQAGLSQTQLAEKLGVTKHSVSRWERTDQMPLAKTHNRIAELLGCKPEDLGVYRPSSVIVDYVGQTKGKLKIVSFAGYGKYQLALWNCECECGNMVVRSSHYLHNAVSPRCDECPRTIKLGKVYKDIRGKRYGKLTVIAPTDRRSAFASAYWQCRCDCSAVIEKTKYYLNNSPEPMCNDCFEQKRQEWLKALYSDDTSAHRIKHVLFKYKTKNESGYPGVYRRGKKWIAKICFQGEMHTLGTFENVNQAIDARKQAENRYFMEYLDQLQKE